MKNYCIVKITKKSSAEQIPQSKVINITRVQINILLVASQQVVSCKPKGCKLGVYHIARQQVMSQSHCKLLANEPMSCQAFTLIIFKAARQPKLI